jgi:hypothetical protein
MILLYFALFFVMVAFGTPPDSPFATPLTPEEAAEGTGLETATPPEQWLPPEYGIRLGMGKFRARLARPGLRRDGESRQDCLFQRLRDKDGRGDIGLTFDGGKLALFDLNWSFDDGWTADEPGAVRDRLDAALRRLGPPTRRWVRERTETFADDAPPVTQTWYVWAWRQGDMDAFFEIRRAANPADRYLRASFTAGAVRRLAPDTPAWLGEPPRDALVPLLEDEESLQPCASDDAFDGWWFRQGDLRTWEQADENGRRWSSRPTGRNPALYPPLVRLPRPVGEAFFALWTKRRTFAAHDPDSGIARAVREEWRRSPEPPLLLVRMDLGDKETDPVDMAISRDGRWLLFEDGYLMPDRSPDAGTPRRAGCPDLWPDCIGDGGCLLEIPSPLRERFRLLASKVPDPASAPAGN